MLQSLCPAQDQKLPFGLAHGLCEEQGPFHVDVGLFALKGCHKAVEAGMLLGIGVGLAGNAVENELFLFGKGAVAHHGKVPPSICSLFCVLCEGQKGLVPSARKERGLGLAVFCCGACRSSARACGCTRGINALAHGFLPPDGQKGCGDEVADGKEQDCVLVAGGDEEGDEVGCEDSSADAGGGFAKACACATQFCGILFCYVELADGEEGVAAESKDCADNKPAFEAFHQGEAYARCCGEQGKEDVHGLATVFFNQMSADHACYGANGHHETAHENRARHLEALGSENGGSIDHDDVPEDQGCREHRVGNDGAGKVRGLEKHGPVGPGPGLGAGFLHGCEDCGIHACTIYKFMRGRRTLFIRLPLYKISSA